MTRRIPWAAGALCALVALCLDVSLSPIPAGDPGIDAVATAGLTLDVPRAQAQSEKPRTAKARLSRCVKYSQEIGEADMTLALTNRCKQALECTMTWSLQCHKDDDEVEATERGETFDIARGKRYTVTASASLCGEDGWSIEDVSWTCRDPAE